MKKGCLIFLVVITSFTPEIYSQNETDSIEVEIQVLNNVKEALKDSIDILDQKIDSLKSVISNTNFDRVKNEQVYVKINPGAAIYKSDHVSSDRLMSATGESTAYIVDIDGSNYVKINIDGIEGFVPKWAFADEEYINSLISKYRNRQPRSEPEPTVTIPNLAQQRALERQKRRTAFVDNNPNLSENFRNQILNGQISIGMTRDMAEASWGEPNDINRTVTANVVSEQWVYGSTANRRYLYFRNDILTSFQD